MCNKYIIKTNLVNIKLTTVFIRTTITEDNKIPLLLIFATVQILQNIYFNQDSSFYKNC